MKIIISRISNEKFGRLRKLAFIIDGKKVFSLKVGETKELEIGKENCIVWVKMDWCRSEKIELNFASGEITLVCGEEKFFHALFATLFYPSKALSLRKIEK
jgi:hypothetical protein